MIDPSARIAAGAVIADDVEIGPFCTIGPNVVIGAGCRLVSHVAIDGHTTLGERNVIRPFASLGTPPQSVHYRGGPTTLVVGSDNDIREGVTMNTGTEDGGGNTRVGSGCFFMVGSHVGHDCTVGDHVVFANNAVLGGHTEVGSYTVFGGQAAVRQFVRIGEGAMIVGLSGVRADVIPFGLVHGQSAELIGLNVVGMKRRGLTKADIHAVHRAFDALFFGEGVFRDRVDVVAEQFAGQPLVETIVAFIRAGTRPLTMGVRRAALRADR
ncbi:Acyl-[acyl-carrier-protein]--UDP-N-acetylglucosamine O-acyltransferase [Rhodovulum sp. PH10]|uniref:acyl-ACP--UDP-N-acetylglucosamine O-acyltransferase n=1 Tax=Rhodovulum sp. PH10 TaxID=1187851 RepID=UPI00027C21B3|nr:acyl-ACP--UDP-N-acetylglucosamine O-acyltransferase [Rhodovulum sp. PH10]EJW12396.1 Acyl-[acyl-carrier-protein]--UDP-N-acetylglucosamine O-acyltransferase [Rhodovulum sp. PH10]